MGDRLGVRLRQLFQDYRAGRLLTGQLKARCIKVLQEFTSAFQEVYRSSATCTNDTI